MSLEGINHGNEQQPLVVTELNCSYRELFWLIERLPMVRRNDDQVLPQEIIHNIAKFFTVNPVIPSEVVASSCSSSSGQHDLQACLDENKSIWWISAIGSMPMGKGEEYVEFKLTSSNLCRLSSLSIEIPPLPLGPLSVRTMRLEGKFGDDSWEAVSPIWIVLNRTGLQTYKLHPPIDAKYVRLVCLTNQISQFFQQPENNGEPDDDQDVHQFAAVGYYCVKFD